MIKRIFAVFIVIFLAFSLVMYPNAADAMLKISGPSTVRAGDSITLSISLTGENLLGADFTVSYDSSKLTYSSISSLLSNWQIDDNETSSGNIKFVTVYNSDGAEINGTKTLFKITFKVKSSLDEGDEINVNVKNIAISDGINDFEPSNSVYSVKIAKPLSNDCTLSDLSIEGFELNEKFSSSKTEYTATVDKDTTSVEINAVKNDSAAKVSVSGESNLTVGVNTVTVKVTAEDGSTEKYIIKITRPEDPDRKKDNDSTLSEITLSVGILSPHFSPDINEYIVYLPYEEDHIEIDVDTNSKLASCENVENDLLVGDNLITFVCTAEDGTTTEYRVTVVRMNEYGTSSDSITDTDSETVFDTETECFESDISDSGQSNETLTETNDETFFEPEQTTSDGEKTQSTLTKPVPLWLVFVLTLGGIIFGSLCAVVVFKR